MIRRRRLLGDFFARRRKPPLPEEAFLLRREDLDDDLAAGCDRLRAAIDETRWGTDTDLLNTCRAIAKAGTANRRNTR